MAQSYTRQSSFVNGDQMDASIFNNEYNQLLNAFSYTTVEGTTGHRHDGTAGQGGNIYKIGDLDFLNKIEADSINNRWGVFVEVGGVATEQVRFQDGVILPVTDSDVDLGSDTLRFKIVYADTADIPTLSTDSFTVNSTTTITGILDEDDMVTNSATAVPTQQSVKAYVDSEVGSIVTGTDESANYNWTGTHTFSGRPTFNSNTPWDSGNLVSPATESYADAAASAIDIDDVTSALTPSLNDLLTFNGTNWVAAANSAVVDESANYAWTGTHTFGGVAPVLVGDYGIGSGTVRTTINFVAGTHYQVPLTVGVDYQAPITAGVDYQAPLVAGTDYQTPLVAGADYQTPLVAGTDYQTPLTDGTDYYSPTNKNIVSYRQTGSQTVSRDAPYTEINWTDGGTGTLTLVTGDFSTNDTITIKKQETDGVLTITVSGGTASLPDGTTAASNTIPDGVACTVTYIKGPSTSFYVSVQG